MLFTRCPECETTFRVTDETLKRAHGQVRCGRCSTVFNAYAELHDPAAKTPVLAAQPPAEPSPEPEPEPEPTPPPAAPAPLTTSSPSAEIARPLDPAAASIGAGSVADVVAEIERGTREAEDARAPEPSAPTAAPEEPISPKQVEAVLTTDLPPPPALWSTLPAEPESRQRSRLWSLAAAVALAALALQVVHHYRTELVSHEQLGPWIQRAYAGIGIEVAPRWDVHQYAILDWVATAEPNARGLGSLKITARIQNKAATKQPFPAVQLRLKDRWETAVGSRMFAPAEYLPSESPRGRLMAPGETARAEIEVVDPGPDAYGFELDVCIEVEADLVTCGTDKVFL